MAERARTPGPLARFFSGLANALLDLGLPRIRAWLRERIGEGATVDDAYTEGSYLHLRGVRIPLGPRGRLVLAEATVALAGKRAADLPELRLHAFRGKVAFGEGDLEADIVFTAVPDPDARAWVAGDLRITNAVWSGSTKDAPRRGPMNGSARLFVTSDEATLEDGRLESPNADVRFTAEATPDPPALRRATIDLPKARVGAFVDAVRSILGRALEIPPGVPPDAGLDGRITWDERNGGTCKLHTSTDGLRATVEGAVDADGQNLQGRIVAEVAPALPMYAMRLPAALVPRDEDVLAIALDLGGDVKRPVVTGTVTGPSVGFRFGRPRFYPVLALGDVHADVAIADDVARVKLRAKASSGSIQASLDLPLRVAVGRRVSARLEGIEAIWLVAVARAFGVDGVKLEGDAAPSGRVISLPRDAKTSAVIAYEHGVDGAAATATVKSRTVSSHLAIEPVAIAGSRITGGRLHGSLDVAEALRMGLFPFGVRPAAEGAITVDLALEGLLREPIAKGHLASPRIVLEMPSRPALEPIPCTDVDVRVVASTAGVTLDPVRFRALGGSFRLDARLGVAFGPDASLLAVHVKDAGVAFLERAASFARARVLVVAERAGERPRNERWIPASARLSGALTLARDGGIASELLLVSDAGTRMAATLDFGAAGKLRTLRLHGPIALADARVLGAFDASPVSIVTEGVAHADVAITPNEPVSGFVFAERLAVSLTHDAAAPLYVATDVLVPFRATGLDAGTSVVWRDACATLYGGRATATGVSLADGSLHASIRVQDARIEDVPRTRSETLASVVRGRLGIELDLVKGAGTSAPVGRGFVALDDAAYPVLALAAGALRRYGLPAPEEISTAPATAELALEPRGVTLRYVRATVPGIQADGDITIRTAPSVAEGAFVVTLGERYLRSSPLLSLPGAIAETLTLPVRIGGPLSKPKVDADLATCLGRFVTENRVTDIVTDAAEGVVSLFTGREPPPPPEAVHAPAPPPERAPRAADPVLERAVGPASAWEPIERRILESGLSSAPRSRYRVV